MAYNSKADKKTSLQAKVQNTQLQKELKAISRAAESSARYHQFKETQFRTKYEKYLTTGNFETSLIKKDSIKQDTKDSLKQDAKGSLKQDAKGSASSSPRPVEPIPLHKLLYTHGEVDVDKVVCIHLLSVQHHKPPSLAHDKNVRLFPKRSKPSVLESSALPFYIVEIDHKIYMESRTSFPQGQEVFIIVNSKLEKLINSITEVLEIVSPLKLKKIKDILMSKKSIQEIMIKNKILNFLTQLKGSGVLMDVENYRIEIAQFQDEPILAPNVLTVTRIMVRDKSRKIEEIQREVRNSINVYTEKNVCIEESWSMLHSKYCNCGKKTSSASINQGRAISLLNDEGTEFARVTGSGCRLPTGSFVQSTSVTAIIKSSPRASTSAGVPEQESGFTLNTVIPAAMRNQEGKLIHSMLHKVKNSHRILIGKKAAEFKSQHANSDKPKQKLPINKIIEDVFSRDSLLSFAATTEHDELKLMFQPCCKGGLGMGSYLLNPKPSGAERNKQLRAAAACQENEAIPQMMRRERSAMDIAQIKQEIFMSETRNKMKKFLQTDNPGETHGK